MAGFESVLAQIPGYGGYLAKAQMNQQQGMNELSQMSGSMGILANIQKMQQQKQMTDLLSSPQFQSMTPEQKQNMLVSIPGGLDMAVKLSTIKNTGVTGLLHSAQLKELQNKGVISGQEQQAKGALANLLSPAGSFGQGTPAENPNSQVFPNDAAALSAAQRADASGVPFTGNVPNPGNVQALTVAAGNALPRGLSTQLIKGMNPVAPTGLSGVGKLIAERDALPTNDPRRQLYDNAIAHQSGAGGDKAQFTNVQADPLKPGQFIGIKKGESSFSPILGGTQGTSPQVTVDTHGEDFLKTLDLATRNTVKAISEGRMAMPSGFALKSPYWQNVLTLVGQYDPQFNAARPAVYKDFTSGVAARNVTAINTAIRHMGTLYDLGKALDNNNIPVLNAIQNRIATETGDPRINNFDTAKSAVGNELMRVFRQVNADTEETKNWELKFKAAQSPAQLQGAIKVGVDLLQGRISALDEQWKRGMNVETGFPNLLTPATKDILGKIGGNPQRRTNDKSPIPSSAVIAPSQIFATEADAAKAGLKPGTRVKIGNTTGTWQ